MEPTTILLLLTILIPAVASVMLLFGRQLGEAASKAVALVGFISPLVIALALAWVFADAPKEGGYAYLSAFDLGLGGMGIQLALGLNGISLPLFLLAGIVGAAAGVYAVQQDVPRKHLYWMLLLFMHTGLMGVFASVDVFFFYFFHEFALIPTFILIGVWGGAERKRAAMEMTIYLTLGALMSLVGLIAIYLNSGAESFNLIELRAFVPLAVQNGDFFWLLLFGFGILVSLFPFHTWAPRGYATAPTPAAMLHAGVLKKFGLYGLLQVVAPMMTFAMLEWVDVILWLALGNVVLIGFVTMAQRNLGRMIGYSSVMHMGYIFLGIASFNHIGAGGAVLLMMAHGLSVALLFLLSDCIEKRAGSLDMGEMGGLGPRAPVLAAFFVAATMASIGLPGFANFWGELSVFIGLWENHTWAVVPAVLGVVISAIYGLRAVERVFFGVPTTAQEQRWQGRQVGDMNLGEKVPAFALVAALLAVGLYPKMITEPLDAEIQAVVPVISDESAPVATQSEPATMAETGEAS